MHPYRGGGTTPHTRMHNHTPTAQAPSALSDPPHQGSTVTPQHTKGSMTLDPAAVHCEKTKEGWERGSAPHGGESSLRQAPLVYHGQISTTESTEPSQANAAASFYHHRLRNRNTRVRYGTCFVNHAPMVCSGRKHAEGKCREGEYVVFLFFCLFVFAFNFKINASNIMQS